MPQHDDIHALAIQVAQINQKIGSIEETQQEIKQAVHSLAGMREAMARFSERHERQQDEMETMWKRVDDLRADLTVVQSKEIGAIKKDLSEWEGASRLARLFFGSVAAGLIAATGYLFGTLTDITVLKEKVRVIEQHHQAGGK